MNVNFLENKPFVAGTSQAWLFDIDFLTDSMSYEKISPTNPFAGTHITNDSNAGSQDDDSESDDDDDEPDVIIIDFTPSTVLPSDGDPTTEKEFDASPLKDPLPDVDTLQDLQRQEQQGVADAITHVFGFPKQHHKDSSVSPSKSAEITPQVFKRQYPIVTRSNIVHIGSKSVPVKPVPADRSSIRADRRTIYAVRYTRSATKSIDAGTPLNFVGHDPFPVDGPSL